MSLFICRTIFAEIEGHFVVTSFVKKAAATTSIILYRVSLQKYWGFTYKFDQFESSFNKDRRALSEVKKVLGKIVFLSLIFLSYNRFGKFHKKILLHVSRKYVYRVSWKLALI